MFSTPETSVHVRDKNRESTPLEREEGYGGKYTAAANEYDTKQLLSAEVGM